MLLPTIDRKGSDNFQTRISDPEMTCHSYISVLVGDADADTRAGIFKYSTNEYLSTVRTNIVHAQRADEYSGDVTVD